MAAPATQQRTLQVTWHVIDLISGRAIDLNTFQPTESFIYLIQYFDQFAQSAAVWSPDSRSLVYTGQPLIGKRGVYVIDAQDAAQAALRRPRRLCHLVVALTHVESISPQTSGNARLAGVGDSPRLGYVLVQFVIFQISLSRLPASWTIAGQAFPNQTIDEAVTHGNRSPAAGRAALSHLDGHAEPSAVDFTLDITETKRLAQDTRMRSSSLSDFLRHLILQPPAPRDIPVVATTPTRKRAPSSPRLPRGSTRRRARPRRRSINSR